ncbi:MAG: Flp family type IVb pilin [Pseudolabrys sp.]|nr:Flp family type IVb pilin [Pseudolabrys sp.]
MLKLSIAQARRFIADESGATAIEYALIAAGVAGAIIGVVGTVGGNVKTMWTTIKNAFG